MPAAPSLVAALRDAWRDTDAFFAALPDLQARPIALRHPFVFYLGHLPAFAHNQLLAQLLGRPPTGPLDALFAFGIDPEDAAAAEAQSISAYPAVPTIEAYRDQVRGAVSDALEEVVARFGAAPVWMVIEHERMHHETLHYMAQVAAVRLGEPVLGDGEASEEVRVPAGEVALGAAPGSLDFGWDNEFPSHGVAVPAFSIDSLPVRQRDWLDFVAAGGPRPAQWVGDAVLSAAGRLPLDAVLGWPVMVSPEQAAAYAAWRGRRLPTEAELARVRHQPAGANVGGRHVTPVPVGSQGPSPSGVRELVGNGWEHTGTAFGPLPGFQANLPGYPGYSADFFDGEHRVVVGGSWVTHPRFLRPSFRNWFRRDYPYAFTKFRTVARSPR